MKLKIKDIIYEVIDYLDIGDNDLNNYYVISIDDRVIRLSQTEVKAIGGEIIFT